MEQAVVTQAVQQERKYLSISNVAMLGECETKFVRAVTGRLFQTRAMKTGTELMRPRLEYTVRFMEELVKESEIFCGPL